MKSIDYHRSNPIKIFFSFFVPHIHLFLLDLSCALLICLVDLGFPLLSRYAMNTLLPQSLYQSFFAVIAIFVAAYLGKGLLYFIVSYWGHTFGVHVEADMRRTLFTHLESLSFEFYDKNRIGVLMSRVTNDLFEVTELAHHGPEDLFISSVTLVGAFCIMCTIEWRLAIIVFSIVPLFLLFTIFQRRKMRRVNLTVKQETAEVNASIESSLSGMRTAKAFGNEEAEIQKFSRVNHEFVTAKRRYYKVMAVFQGGMEFFVSMMPVLVIAAGGFFIMDGSMNFTDLLTFTLYVTIFTTPVKKLVSFVEQFMQGMAGFSRFLELMRTKPQVQDAPDATTLTSARGDIEFQGVSFHYSEGSEVLHDINLRIHAGEKVAVVGPSGGGKTTLCQLIPRFYEASEGRILLDGKNVNTVTQKSLRQQIGIVQQDVFLFADSILENIRYGRPEASDEEVMLAAMQAEIHHDIIQMPNGYQSFVGERGVMLSGGQKQRISIARVFLKNPPIVILDEATSALDSVTEAKIQASFDLLCQGRTSIVIAHRLSTVRDADHIVVVENSRIVEQGPHQQLMAQKGPYALLVTAQQEIGHLHSD